jgi:hypothetical protein
MLQQPLARDSCCCLDLLAGESGAAHHCWCRPYHCCSACTHVKHTCLTFVCCLYGMCTVLLRSEHFSTGRTPAMIAIVHLERCGTAAVVCNTCALQEPQLPADGFGALLRTAHLSGVFLQDPRRPAALHPAGLKAEDRRHLHNKGNILQSPTCCCTSSCVWQTQRPMRLCIAGRSPSRIQSQSYSTCLRK